MASKDSGDDIGEAKDNGIADERADSKTVSNETAGVHAGSPTKPEVGERPPTGMLSGYTQTYLVWKSKGGGEEGTPGDGGGDGKDSAEEQCEHEVLFRCGNWCYTGHVVLNKEISLGDLPLAIPLLQRQQSRLHYYCNADGIPAASNFSQPMRLVYDASDYTAAALSSDALQKELEVIGSANQWMEDSSNTFFEMAVNREGLPDCMDDIALVCSKSYARGLVFVTIFFEGTFYFTVSDGEGDQPLLDVKFPDVSQHGQGIQLSSAGFTSSSTTPVVHDTFDSRAPPGWFSGLTLWHSLPTEVKLAPPPTRNLSSSEYMQMYMILRPRAENGGFAVTSAYREVLFRFGSWCYGGSVQLTPCITLADIPHVIPALRMQQSRLEFVYSADAVPATSPYAKPMGYMMKHAPLMEREIASAESVLSKLVERLTNMGLGESISSWLEGESTQSFFEFSVAVSDAEAKVLAPVELVATKSYYASGIVLVVIYFGGAFYVVVSDAGSEQPLLDSKFPDVSSKGRGYQVNSYPEGAEGWEGLRKVSVWQTTSAMSAEMEARAGKDGAAVATAMKTGTLATAEAVEAMEQGSKATEPAQTSQPEVAAEDREGASGAAAAPAKDDASAPSAAKDTPATSSASATALDAKAEAKQPAVMGHGGGIGDAERSQRQSLGAFHRLQPMSGVESSLAKIRSNMGEDGGGGLAAPWDATGRPKALGKGLGSPFGKAPLDFKKSPGGL